MLPYSARGVPVRMAFAKDLAVRASQRTNAFTVTASVRFDKSGVLEEQRQQAEHTIEAENDHDEEVGLVSELPRSCRAARSRRTARHRGRRLPITGGSSSLFRCTERLLSLCARCGPCGRVAFDSLAAPQLDEWLRGRFLDSGTFGALSGVLGRWQRARELEEQRKRVLADSDQAYAKQTKIQRAAQCAEGRRPGRGRCGCGT